jgi:hypothetical protein
MTINPFHDCRCFTAEACVDCLPVIMSPVTDAVRLINCHKFDEAGTLGVNAAYSLAEAERCRAQTQQHRPQPSRH